MRNDKNQYLWLQKKWTAQINFLLKRLKNWSRYFRAKNATSLPQARQNCCSTRKLSMSNLCACVATIKLRSSRTRKSWISTIFKFTRWCIFKNPCFNIFWNCYLLLEIVILFLARRKSIAVIAVSAQSIKLLCRGTRWKNIAD